MKQQLTKQGYIVDACGDGEEGFLLALDNSSSYDLAVIDRMLPVVDGLTIIKAMRNKQKQIPVIIIAGMSELQNKIEGLGSGADDYLSKPFHMEELSARIRALIRRPVSISRERSLSFHNISLDLAKRQLMYKKNSVTLTPTEFHLMQVFLAQPDTLLTRKQLIQKVWKTDASVQWQVTAFFLPYTVPDIYWRLETIKRLKRNLHILLIGSLMLVFSIVFCLLIMS